MEKKPIAEIFTYSKNKIYAKHYILIYIYINVIKVHTFHSNDKHENQDSLTPGEWKVNDTEEEYIGDFNTKVFKLGGRYMVICSIH